MTGSFLSHSGNRTPRSLQLLGATLAHHGVDGHVKQDPSGSRFSAFCPRFGSKGSFGWGLGQKIHFDLEWSNRSLAPIATRIANEQLSPNVTGE